MMIDRLLDAVLPAICLHCDDRLQPGDELVCARCRGRLAACRRSHVRSIPIGEHVAARASVLSLWIYASGSPVRSLHRALKYGGRRDVGISTGRQMGRWARSRLVYPDGRTVVLPVPSHPIRMAERGYNHAEVLARGVCDELRLDCHPEGLERTRLSVSQSGVSRSRRSENVRGAFAVRDARLLSGRPALIVDDVFTTGATLRETSMIVRNAGATFVAALTMAIRIVR